ncbi:hypothetical protein EON76_04495 [bacterium]|nr:MAG: hypothetical protein EON76_04495 [bacterium]
MTHAVSLRRMAENQVVFRKMNEQAKTFVDELARIADEDERMKDMRHDDKTLQFYCECSDEDCRLRIAIQPSVYNKIHAQPDHFAILPGHNLPAIESVVEQHDSFIVVKKFSIPSQDVTELTSTPLKNAS